MISPSLLMMLISLMPFSRALLQIIGQAGGFGLRGEILDTHLDALEIS